MDENKNAGFRHETVISGMYIYRMTMGEAVYNGKVVFKKELQRAESMEQRCFAPCS